MHFQLSCECGQRVTIPEGAAGTSVACPCGRYIPVPSLGELRRQSNVSRLMTAPGIADKQVARADVDWAMNRLNEGATPDEVRRQLLDRGYDEWTAETLVWNFVRQAVCADAAALLDRGVSAKDAERHLVERGVDRRVAAGAIEDVLQARLEEQAGAGRVVLSVLGGIVFVIGIGLLIGNVTGLFPTVPMAGFIVTTIGAAIIGAGRAR